MAGKIIWVKLRSAVSAAISIGVFGLNSFILLLLKNPSDKSMVYVICVASIAYIITLFAEFISYRKKTEQRTKIIARTRLIFRWIYVAINLTIIIINMIHAGWNGSVNFTDNKLIYRMIMFVFIALTIPRDMFMRKVLAWAKQKWKIRNEKNKGRKRKMRLCAREH